MQEYEEKAITGITAEVTIAQIEALSHNMQGLKEQCRDGKPNI